MCLMFFFIFTSMTYFITGYDNISSLTIVKIIINVNNNKNIF
jgi:hypothetical protein